MGRATTLSSLDLDAVNARLEGAQASSAVRWAVDTFGVGELCLLASFQDAVLIDVATKVEPGIEVVFIDTGDHFDETYDTVERVRARYGLNLRVLRAPEPEVPYHEVDPVKCCSDVKVALLEQALEGKRAWLSGLRRVEAATRTDAPVVGLDKRDLVKVNPLATWTDLDVAGYVRANDVPYNPLLDQGYPSIGCKWTTSPVEDGADPRSGRWAGSDTTECGLHL